MGKYRTIVSIAAVLGAMFLSVESLIAETSDESVKYWPKWRGPLSTGVAPKGDPPIEWSENKNIRWKTALPGSGHSTPIVWKDHVFVTAAIPYGKVQIQKGPEIEGVHDYEPVTRALEFVVIALNRPNGKILWRKTVIKALPHEGIHYTGTMASNSAVTDGLNVYAFFGSRGLHCVSFRGEKKWSIDLGKMRIKHGHGEGSSPALYGNTVIVNWDHEDQSFIAAFDKRTGKQLWKTKRQEVTSWATPIVVKVDGKPQVIVNGTKRMRGYNLENGKVIWRCAGLSANIVASPVSSDGVVYAGSSYVKQGMLAIRLSGSRGDISSSDHVIWRRRRGTPYVPSLLLYDKSLYFLHHYQPVMSRLDVKTGQDTEGPYRLPGIRNVYASPVGAAERVYITDRTGATLVLKHDKELKILALNRLAEPINASAAIVGREMFLRGDQSLYCISAPGEKKTPTTAPSKP
ncbi:MAG: PQQ-binding-like beta-propeller repeat protein [Phycisphaerae bacterium]|nr:PQQ-binding-like beta-propeller repeat protein [Phycisphaerae bacterium]